METPSILAFLDAAMDDSTQISSSDRSWITKASSSGTQWPSTPIRELLPNSSHQQFPPGTVTNTFAVHGRDVEATFIWKSKLPGFNPDGYRLKAVKGVYGTNVMKSLLEEMDDDCKAYLQSLDVSTKKKAYKSMYNSYREYVGGGKIRREQKVCRWPVALKSRFVI